MSGAGGLLDYITHLRLPQQQQPSTDIDSKDQLTDLRDEAHTMIGELYVMYESLRRVALRHPEIDSERWDASSGTSGVDERW